MYAPRSPRASRAKIVFAVAAENSAMRSLALREGRKFEPSPWQISSATMRRTHSAYCSSPTSKVISPSSRNGWSPGGPATSSRSISRHWRATRVRIGSPPSCTSNPRSRIWEYGTMLMTGRSTGRGISASRPTCSSSPVA